MRNNIGPQYNKDNIFKAKARLHQSKFRAEVLELKDYSDYGNRLSEQDAKDGKNFFQDYNIFEAVKDYEGYSGKLYSDMLRSEHIPWNIFIPFVEERELFIDVFNNLIDREIASVVDIIIEYAPKPKEEYLNDRTAFDAFIDLELKSGENIFLGIEVKYTEGAYPIGKKEKNMVNDPDSIYYQVTRKSGSFTEESIALLKEDNYRQIWRNYILAESLLMNSGYDDFRSITLYPEGNTHFTEKTNAFKNFLKPERQYRLIGLTFEKLFEPITKYANTKRSKKWASYLQSRYLVSTS